MHAQVKMVASEHLADMLPLNVSCVPALARCQALIRQLLTTPDPMFLGRVGGSDTDFVIELFGLAAEVGLPEALRRLEPRFGLVKLFNGYYDKEQSTAKVQRFCEFLLHQYSICPDMFVVGAPLLCELMPETINRAFHVDTSAVRPAMRVFLRSIAARQNALRLFPYAYVENVLQGPHSLFRLLGEVLKDKRVLLVTPFEQSIRANFARRHELFPNFQYPDFELRTYNAPVTYHGLPQTYYPDLDWFATLERMQREIETIDFDIALLACGSYAMPLGNHIRDVGKRKAVYVGGCLQLFCGIMGRRYENPFFLNQINEAAFIKPIERDGFLKHVKIEPSTARDAFGAYF